MHRIDISMEMDIAFEYGDRSYTIMHSVHSTTVATKDGTVTLYADGMVHTTAVNHRLESMTHHIRKYIGYIPLDERKAFVLSLIHM